MAGKIIFIKPWVIDSGAIEHITCDSALLIEERFTNQQPVKIPNGQNIPVKSIGIAELPVKSIGITELPNGVKVNNVLNIPDFKCNLLSVSKLTREHNCALTFVDDLCVIQDLTTRTLIGVGRHQNGLSLLEPIQDGVVAMKVDRSIDESVWHWRLGHASETKMKQIEPLFDIASNSSFMHCDSCIRAK
uniref:Uncharacterized protein n=1 Tax=Cajanus cajan TaxID=3821 RepID=A0A151SFB4_CAJCA|nr:hypothetical protein KK1_024658 [Cajanus cajan]